MNPQPTFTFHLNNNEIKIFKHLNELYIEVQNLETLRLHTCSLKEQDLSLENSRWFKNLDELRQLLSDGLQNPSKTLRTTITGDVMICLWVSDAKGFTSCEFPLREIQFMSSEHLERLQQRTDFSAYLPKNNVGVLLAMVLKTQQEQNHKLKQPQQEGLIEENTTKLRELEGQVKSLKSDNDLLKVQIKNLESKTDRSLSELETKLQIILKKFDKSKENEEFRQQQEEILKQLKELKERLNTKVDKAFQNEIKGLQDIDMVISVDMLPANSNNNTKALEDMVKVFDEKIAKVYEFITQQIKETKEANEKALNVQKETSLEQYNTLNYKIGRCYEEQNNHTDEKLQVIHTKLEKLENQSNTSTTKISSMEEKISQLQDQFEVCRDLIGAFQGNQDHNDVISYVNRTIQEVKETIEREIERKRDEDMASLEARLEQLRQAQRNLIDERVQESVNNLAVVLQANEDELRNRVERVEQTNATLAELVGGNV